MALAKSPYNQYQQQSVNTATPEKLLIMLFDGALKFAAQAGRFLEEQDYEQSNYFLKRVQAIVEELMVSLDKEFQFYSDLIGLYDFIYQKMIDANLKKDVVALREGEKVLQELRDTWAEAAKIIGKEKAEERARKKMHAEPILAE